MHDMNMTTEKAIAILNNHRLNECDNQKLIRAELEAIKALETVKKIKEIIREVEHYEVSNSFENPHPNKADYDAVAADKYQRIWELVAEAEKSQPDCFISNEEPYPLCKGRGEKKCHNCCIYEDYEKYHSPYNE